jgi:hypothetical protein
MRLGSRTGFQPVWFRFSSTSTATGWKPVLRDAKDISSSADVYSYEVIGPCPIQFTLSSKLIRNRRQKKRFRLPRRCKHKRPRKIQGRKTLSRLARKRGRLWRATRNKPAAAIRTRAARITDSRFQNHTEEMMPGVCRLLVAQASACGGCLGEHQNPQAEACATKSFHTFRFSPS